MRLSPTSGPLRLLAIASSLLFLPGAPASADDSSLVRLLKSGRVPEDRQPQIVAKIARLGSPADLKFLLDRSADPGGFAPGVRRKALDALVGAALTRKGIKPEGDLAALGRVWDRAKDDPESRVSAIRLVGLWKLEDLRPRLMETIADPRATDPERTAAVESLAEIGGQASLLPLTATDRPARVRQSAVIALARMDATASARLAASILRDASKTDDVQPLVAAFLNLKGGPDALASAIESAAISADNAKLTLRAIYALGHADAPLIAALSRAAGIENETRPPSREEMDRLVAEVNARGDSARGERVFRRADLNCMKCHSIAGAAGGVGPDLSSVGLSSPVDYVINSILLPDQAIKEQYHTLVVATADGQVFQGIVADKDESKVVLRQATGELKTVPASEIEETKEGGSLMPKGLANLLTRDEFLDLVRFVSELGKPGPYAIRPTPTVQRWRLLKPVPDDLARSVPDPGTFVARVRDSDPASWVAGYGLANGEIPLDEFASLAESPVIYARGEIEVSSPGPLRVRLGADSGVTAWVDSDPVPSGPSFTADFAAGVHALTLRIDPSKTGGKAVKVEVEKAPGSSAEFVVRGGR